MRKGKDSNGPVAFAQFAALFSLVRIYIQYTYVNRGEVKYKALSGYKTTSISLDLHLSPFVQRISNFIDSFIVLT